MDNDGNKDLFVTNGVLKDINKQDPDLILFAGDLCVFGSQPAACVQLMRSADIGSIHGKCRWCLG